MVIAEVKLVELVSVTIGVMLSGKGMGVVLPGPMYSHVALGRRGEPNTEQTKVTSPPTEIDESKTMARISWSSETSA